MAPQPAQSDSEWVPGIFYEPVHPDDPIAHGRRWKAELDQLRAGVQWVRGMCSDGEPLEVIDAKLGEILNGAAPDQERNA